RRHRAPLARPRLRDVHGGVRRRADAFGGHEGDRGGLRGRPGGAGAGGGAVRMSRVFVSQEIVEEALEEFEGTGITVDLRRDHTPLPAAELRAAATAYDGLICLLTDRIDAEFLEACPRL